MPQQDSLPEDPRHRIGCLRSLHLPPGGRLGELTLLIGNDHEHGAAVLIRTSARFLYGAEFAPRQPGHASGRAGLQQVGAQLYSAG